MLKQLLRLSAPLMVLFFLASPTVSAAPVSGTTFSDVSAAAGLPPSALDTHGLEWGDYDNDGDPDLHISFSHQGLTEPVKQSALYRNNGDGTFTDVITTAQISERFDRHGCSWGDYDNDGFLDFVCSSGGGQGESLISWDRLWRNNRDGTFTRVDPLVGLDDNLGRGRTAIWLDFDLDLDLDLFFANETRTGAPNRLYRNDGGVFTDVSAASGLGVETSSHGASAADYDNDGDPDIVVGTASNGTKLYRNNGNGTFTDVTGSSGITGNGEGLAWGDYDNDGDVDLFVGRIGGGNSALFRNNGNGTFTNVTNAAQIGLTKVRAGIWADFDNDGDLDLFVVRSDDPNTGLNMADVLYLNQGNGTFVDSAAAAGVQGPTEGWGDTAAWADYDRDGFIDLMVLNSQDHAPTGVNGPPILYRNDGNANHWIEVRRRTSGPNGFGVGAKAWVTVGGVTQYRELTDQVGARHLQNDQIIHFGVGDAIVIDELRVEWPDGEVTQMTDVGVDQVLDLSPPPTLTVIKKVLNLEGGTAVPGDFTLRVTNDATGLDVPGSPFLGLDDPGLTFTLPEGSYSVSELPLPGYAGSFNGECTAVPLLRGDRRVCNLTNVDIAVPEFTEVAGPAGLQWDLSRPQSWGIEWADYNNDGWPDALYGRHGGKKQSLYRNNGDGTFTDVGAAAGIQLGQDKHGCAWGDLNNDGNIDLLCTGDRYPRQPFLMPRLYRNNGNGTFTDIAEQVGLTACCKRGRSATWLDFNNDGRLDFFTTGENWYNSLLQNQGGWPGGSFLDVIKNPLKNVPNTMQETVSSVDYDNDDRWDIFVAAHRKAKHTRQQVWLYRNLGNNNWSEESLNAGVFADMAHSGSWGDYDNDGWMDLFVGTRVTPYPDQPWLDEAIPPLKLYRNLGPDGSGKVRFEDVTATAGIREHKKARMGLWGDFNNDGRLDLLVVNGMGLFDTTNPPDELYMNKGDGSFVEVAVGANIDGDGIGSGDGAAWADYDRDGFLDILVANGGGFVTCSTDKEPNECIGPPRLYRNTPNGKHWIQLNLDATRDAFGYGSKVTLTAGGVTQYRQISDGRASHSQNDQTTHFGVNDSTIIDSIVIRWPDATETTLECVPVDQEITVVQGAPNPWTCAAGGGPSSAALEEAKKSKPSPANKRPAPPIRVRPGLDEPVDERIESWHPPTGEPGTEPPGADRPINIQPDDWHPREGTPRGGGRGREGPLADEPEADVPSAGGSSQERRLGEKLRRRGPARGRHWRRRPGRRDAVPGRPPQSGHRSEENLQT